MRRGGYGRHESNVRYEGIRYFDVIFYVRTADGLSKIIINIEAQKSEPTHYDVEMRGLYYAICEVSSQSVRQIPLERYVRTDQRCYYPSF